VLFVIATVGCGLISNEDASQAIAEGRESQRLIIEEADPLEKEIQLLQDTAESLISDIDDIERQLEDLFVQEENIYRNEIEPLYKQIDSLDSELNKVNQSMAYEQSGNAQNDVMSKVNALELQLQTIHIKEIRPLDSQREDIYRSMDFDPETRDQISSLEDESEALNDEIEDLYDKREDTYDLEDNRDAIEKLVDAIDADIKPLEDQSEAVGDSINAKYKEERDRIKELEEQLDGLKQQIDDIQILKVKPLEEEILQLINESQKSQNAGSSDESDTPKEQDMPEEIKVLLLDQDNLRNQIKEIEETKIPAIRDQIDALRVERLAKRNQLSGIYDDMKPKVEKLNEIYGEIDSKRAALEGTILDILEAANEKYN
jgi:chromosome segregation ATPase